MKILIKSGSHSKYGNNPKYQDKLRRVEGQWLDVDLEYLFTSQFNTKPIPDITESGLRIYDSDVEKIEDDERTGRSRCGYCGLWVDTGKPCEGCTKGTKEMVEFFPGTKRVTGIKSEVSSILGDVFKVSMLFLTVIV